MFRAVFQSSMHRSPLALVPVVSMIKAARLVLEPTTTSCSTETKMKIIHVWFEPRPATRHDNMRRLTDPHFSEAALAQLDLQAEGFSRDFPGVLGESLSLRLDGGAHGGQPVAKAVRVFWTEARRRSHKRVMRSSLTVRVGGKWKQKTDGAQEEQRVGAVDRDLYVCLEIALRFSNSAWNRLNWLSTGLLQIKGGICFRRRSGLPRTKALTHSA